MAVAAMDMDMVKMMLMLKMARQWVLEKTKTWNR